MAVVFAHGVGRGDAVTEDFTKSFEHGSMILPNGKRPIG
jgi:hypothetical protein